MPSKLSKIRRILKKSNLLLTLIEAYREDELTEREREYLWIGIHDLALRLANRHYKERQRVRPLTAWNEDRRTDAEEKHAIRMEYLYRFIKEYKEGTPATSILYAIHRRFPQLELLVEFKFVGIDIEPDRSMPTRTNLGVVKDIMLGCKLHRRLSTQIHTPTFRELIHEYAVTRIESGKLVGWDDITRFASRVIPYFLIKNARYPLCFEDERYNHELYVDML